jgi:hypothetical protein
MSTTPTAPPVFRDDESMRRYLCDTFNARRAADPALEAVDIVEPEQVIEYVIRTGVVLSDGSQILAVLDLRPLVALMCEPRGTAH